MKLAILSDIHSNLTALKAALEAVEARTVDAVYCLGDIVGYGAEPGACVDLIRETCAACVLGNHDLAVARDEGTAYLPKDGQVAARHNREQLTEAQRAFLDGLPLRLEAHGCTFVHASPDAPERWHRIGSFRAATAQFSYFDTPVCFVGHTHMPAVMSDRLGVFSVRPGRRYLINIGSVGQPRDSDIRVCVAFFDTETFHYELVRVPYDVERAAASILAAGLPRALANRLFRGQ